MKTWEFEATDPDGVRFASTVEAGSFEEARAQVIAMEMTLVSLELVDDDDDHNGGGDGGRNGQRRGGRDSGRAPHREPSGLRPGPPRRELSAGDRKGLNRASRFWILFGGLFFGVGLLFNLIAVGIIISGNWQGAFMLFTLVHTAIGAFFLRKGLTSRRQDFDVAANGVSVIGRVVDIRLKRNVRVNGRHPTIVEYAFDVDGRDHTGRHETLNPSAGRYVEGDSVWVLHDPADASRNIVWPPG